MEKTLTNLNYETRQDTLWGGYFLNVWYHWLRSELQNAQDPSVLRSWFPQLGQKAVVDCGVSGFMEDVVAFSMIVRFVCFSFTDGVISWVIWAYNGVIVTTKSKVAIKKGIIALKGLSLTVNLEKKVVTCVFFILKSLFHPSAYFHSFINFYEDISG